MTKTKTILIFTATMLAAALLRAEGTLSVSPAVVTLRGNPGQSTTQKLTILNTTSQPFTFDMVAKDVVVRNGDRSFAEAGTLGGSVAATAVFSRKTITVAPGERVAVDVTVTVPEKPVARAVVALFQGTTRVKRDRTHFTASLGTLLTFALSDEVTATTSPLTVTPPTAAKNLAVSQELSNNGNEPVVARGMLAIVDATGALVAKQPIAPVRLLPGEASRVHAEFPGELASGRYRALVTYDLQSAKTITSQADFNVR